jgi:NADPH2:quinone reductase
MEELSTMRAAWFDKFGAARDVLQVGELDAPVAGPGEVLVKIHTSGVNPSDVKKRAGSFPDLLDEGFVIPNSDGAGVIEAIGHDIDKNRLGERVWIYQAQFARRFGTAADYVAIEANRTLRLPDEASFELGACLGIPAMTAHRCVFADGDVSGQIVLVTGGAGRVGNYAVQWASQAGATVIASASNAADKSACEAAGAHHVVNHRDDGVVGAIMATTGGQPVDRIVDVEFGANLPMSIEVLRVGGTIATYSSTQVSEPKLPFYPMMYKDITVRMVIVYAMPEAAKEQAVADIGKALSAGTLQHRIARTMPLAEIARANEIIEEGNIRGAVVLTID